MNQEQRAPTPPFDPHQVMVRLQQLELENANMRAQDERIQQLEIENANMRAEGQRLEAEHKATREALRLMELERENKNLQLRVAEIELEQSKARLTAAPLPKPVWPEKHDGTKSMTRGFVNSFKNVVKMRPDYYTDEIKIATFGSLLKGAALEWYNPLVERPEEFHDILITFETFLDHFEATFGIVNREKVAFDKLKKLKQGRGPASTYAAMFRSLVVDVDWNETAKMQHFKDGLNVEVKRLLLARAKPHSLEMLIADAVELDQELHQLLQEAKQYSGTSYHQPRMNLSGPLPAHRKPSDTLAMEIDGVEHYGPLTPTQREYRMSKGLCLVCGLAGHLKVNCPKSKLKRISMVDMVKLDGEEGIEA